MGISEYKLLPKLEHEDEDNVDSISPHTPLEQGAGLAQE